VTRWHVVTCEYPPDVGGVSGYTGQLARALAAAGDDVHVWCPGPARGADAGVTVHAELGTMSPRDLRRVSDQLDALPGPRRLLVQWVPHGFGYRSMNLGFCLWLARRARAGDQIELMVHEPYSDFAWRPSLAAMAAVHRLMTVVLMAAARRAWISIPAWEARLRPYALGRAVPMAWLPIPGCVERDACGDAGVVRGRFAAPRQPLIGHFGSHGRAVASLLDACLPAILSGPRQPALLLIGSDSAAYAERLLACHPSFTGRVHAVGFLDDEPLAVHLAACDVLLQPYTDGVTSRRTSVMTCLSQRRPVVTTTGHLTEPLWAASGAVVLADVRYPVRLVEATQQLLDDPELRARLGVRARQVYDERFSLDRVVSTLRAA
jgi:glycosyltransferase involved in cell wall biosynthesis